MLQGLFKSPSVVAMRTPPSFVPAGIVWPSVRWLLPGTNVTRLLQFRSPAGRSRICVLFAVSPSVVSSVQEGLPLTAKSTKSDGIALQSFTVSAGLKALSGRVAITQAEKLGVV